ncbi:hypothetical protein [Leifsonia shinshuensis]|uniref:DNA-binding protein n=1 Tax=Leifsonia shinshuensis TaxID=150026 RepID=A0A853CXE9_9MICO|nr:hypothetical protein [Leifsonia shinshuensis]NYJ23480.1 hypothetical protein [Leifsonia shinshuensis]
MAVTHPDITESQRMRFYSPKQVCDERWPGMTVEVLAQLRYAGTGPRYVRLSPKKIVYSEAALAEYERAQERTSTAAGS